MNPDDWTTLPEPKGEHATMIETPKAIPVLPAWRRRWPGDRSYSLVVWCVYCDWWHSHGAGDFPGDGDGHRVAHCFDIFDSRGERVDGQQPYEATGYYIREVGDFDDLPDDIKRRRQRATNRLPSRPAPIPRCLGCGAPFARTAQP